LIASLYCASHNPICCGLTLANHKKGFKKMHVKVIEAVAPTPTAVSESRLWPVAIIIFGLVASASWTAILGYGAVKLVMFAILAP
jgi:hypothetical protein